MTIGDEIIEAPMAWRARFFEYEAQGSKFFNDVINTIESVQKDNFQNEIVLARWKYKFSY